MYKRCFSARENEHVKKRFSRANDRLWEVAILRRRISEINEKWYGTPAKSQDEESTIQGFICPLLEALGWDSRTDLRREVNDIDCVFYFENRPHIGIETKSLSWGTLDESKENVKFNRDRLLKNCRNIGAKWAVLTRYIETIIYKVETGERIACFSHPNEYLDNLKNLKVLMKPSL